MKKVIAAFVWAAVALIRLYPEVPIVVADVTADKDFLDRFDDKHYSDILFSSLHSLAGERDYTYLQARSIGTDNAADWRVKNEIDAFAVTNEMDLNYLIYGSIASSQAKTGNYESSFKIYSRKDDKVVREVEYQSPSDDRDSFIKEVAFKINLAVYQLLGSGIKDESGKIANDIDRYNRDKDLRERLKDFRPADFLGLVFSAGYPAPFGSWGDLFTGVVDLEAGVRIVRIPPLVDGDFLKISVRPGFTFSYTLEKNRPEIVEEYMHSFVFRVPVEFLFAIKDRYIVNAGIDLHARVDLTYQNLYGQSESYNTNSAFGWCAGLGFEYVLDPDGVFTIGLANKLDFGAYNVFYFDYKIQSYLLIRFKKEAEQAKIDGNDIRIKL